MYSSYTRATLALRAEASFPYAHISLADHRPESPRCRCRCCCTVACESATWLPLYRVSINPRSVYGFHLRQSSFLHWSPSRSLFSSAAAAGHYRRCAAAEGAAGFGEMIGILAEVEGHFRDISRWDFGCSESHWEEEIEIEKKPRTKMRDFGSNSLRKESSLAKRRNGLRRECSSEVKEGRRRRVHGELSSSYGNRVADVEKEVREVNKYEDSSVEKKRMDLRKDAKASSSSKIYEVEMSEGEEGEEKESRGGYQEVTRTTDVREVDMEKVYGRVNVPSEAREEYGRGERMRVVGRRGSREVSRNASGSMNSSCEVEEESVSRGQKGAEQMELREESQMVTRASKMHKDDRKMLSRSMDAAHKEREVYIQGEKHSFGQRESGEEYRKIAGVSEVHENDTRWTSSKSVVDTRLVDNGASSSSIVQHHSYVDNRVAGRTTSNRSSQRLVDISEIEDSDIKRASSHSQRHFQEMRSKDSEDVSTSAQVTRDKRTQINIQEIESIDIDRRHMYNTNVSTAQVTGIQGETSSRSHVDTTTGDQVDYTTSTVNLVHDVREEQNQSRQQVLQQHSSRKDFERTMDSAQYSRGSMEMVSNPREATHARTDKRKEASSSVCARNKRGGHGPVTGESSRSTETRTAHSASLSSGSSSIQTATSGLNDQISRDEIYLAKADVMESVRRSDKSSAMYLGEFVDRLQQELSSSDTVDDASRQYPRSQTDKLQQQTGQLSVAISGGIDSTSEHKEKKIIQESARQSSSRSGPKGPSDEMWDVRSLYSEEPSRREELGENASSKGVTDSTNASERAESSITRRAHRSLWTYVADIIRKSWHTNVGTHNSTVKSGTRSSSNESVGSEAWFSGREPDENDDETEQGGRDGDANESVTNRKAADQYPVSSQGKSEASRPGASIAMLEGSTSTLMGSMERGPSFKDASRVSRPEHLGSIEDERERQGVAFRFATVDQSSSSTGITASAIVEEENTEVEMPESSSTSMGSMRRRPLSKVASLVSRPEHQGVIEGEREKQGVSSRVAAVDQSSSLTSVSLSATSEGDITELVMHGSGSAKLGEELMRGKLPDIGGIEEKDGDLKRRKFQRSNQVMREQFDEWEEAYKHETEQRKVDEFFMREAILEAKKAADMWEVPVGAVLVQNGKIIARGCNLVEEYRDSTAHAEMICIREASNLLRTWRLSETTLYVTLEPCAMCAGAILQARIDTVVWGAPNKLLGADGSWVRLFPGDGGSNNLDPLNQMAGPVHPFHPKITIRRGILSTECADVMQQFFQLRRKNKKREPSPPSGLPLSTHRPGLFTRMHDIFCMMFCL